LSIDKKVDQSLICYHCGDQCKDDSVRIIEKTFCCNGCKTVFEILDENNLCNYYNLQDAPGISPAGFQSTKFDYLDDEQVIQQLIEFSDEKLTKITLDIPQIHCSSCIWLLENLYKLNSGVTASHVNFLKKKLSVSFLQNKINLKELVKLLTSIGYEPQILLDSVEPMNESKTRSTLYYRIGVAGFSFMNIMLLSFPEYLGIDLSDAFLKQFFLYVNLLLALPVFFYSAWEYFGSAFKGMRKKVINIDVPISLGILVLFIRSVYEVSSGTGAGYFDSLTGLVFFLLIGKLFQEKTYGALNFERNYKSFFPLSVMVKKDGKEKSIPVAKLMKSNRILIRHNEIIPADSILLNGNGKIDYSFVTGESKPVEKVSGEMIYAGGRQIGGAIELEVIKEVSQSYLTQLRNNDIFNNPDKFGESDFTHFSNVVSKYFTAVILLVAIGATLFWLPVSAGKAINVFTSVLIIACPCALALSIPFTLGNTLRIYGKNKFYLKNITAIENMGRVDTIVFDKTGTLTKPGKSDITFNGKILTYSEQRMVKSLARNSVHPLSKKIYSSLEGNDFYPVTNFMETTGMGMEGIVYGHIVKIGSKNFVLADVDIHTKLFLHKNEKTFSTKVYLSVDEELLGYFELSNSYREGINLLLEDIERKYNLYLLSGDNEGEKDNLLKFFKNESQLFFDQTPENKLRFIDNMQSNGRKVLMIGDGLNDAGALKQSDVGIAVTENTGNFSPASDAILDAGKFNLLPKFIKFSRTSVYIIFISFAISFLYNMIGLGFAVQGILSPIVAAILMPLSSISVVVFATLSTNLIARRRGLLSQF
jgi:Cu+-exporting ATPase